MSGRTSKGIQEIQEIVRTGLRNDTDKQTADAKFRHIQEKLENLKDMAVQQQQRHKTELKQKDKEITKLKERNKELQQKQFEFRHSNKKVTQLKKNAQPNYMKEWAEDAGSGNWGELERLEEKNKEAQQRLRQMQAKIVDLQKKLKLTEDENQKLKEESSLKTIALVKYEQMYLTQSARAQQESAKKQKSMDLSEGKGKKFEEDEEDFSEIVQDSETEDEENQQEYSQYQSEDEQIVEKEPPQQILQELNPRETEDEQCQAQPAQRSSQRTATETKDTVENSFTEIQLTEHLNEQHVHTTKSLFGWLSWLFNRGKR